MWASWQREPRSSPPPPICFCHWPTQRTSQLGKERAEAVAIRAPGLPPSPDLCFLPSLAGNPENPSPVPSAASPTSPPHSLPPQPSPPSLPTAVSPTLLLLPTPETAPPDLSQPSPVEPPEDTVSTVSDACPGPSTSRGALQEDLPQGPDAEASSLQPPRPIFAWSSSSASTEYLRLSATCSFSPSCLSLNPSASPPQGFHNVQGKLENLMALQNKQVEDRQEDPMSFRAHLQHVVVMKRQL
ncbi:uncharacterized protein LOC128337692 [Hemicordylus capensis]|uniref:uncharacterized protein LOC128337692 n=1 Tax=Hemicordylus capensis TaxID=884348 RepID=UPI00230420B7|nr:uncharacterized protein LOC128337692 [Hemicordylus capensis]